MLYPEVISSGFFHINVSTFTTFSVSGGSNFLIKICQIVATMIVISGFNEFYKFNFWWVLAIWHNCALQSKREFLSRHSSQVMHQLARTAHHSVLYMVTYTYVERGCGSFILYAIWAMGPI